MIIYLGNLKSLFGKIFYPMASLDFFQRPLIFIILTIFPKVIDKYKHKVNIKQSNSVCLIRLY
jgi:hypothetical protein